MSMNVSAPGGLAIFEIDQKCALLLAGHLILDCTSFYYEPEPYDKCSFWLNGANLERISLWMSAHGIGYKLETTP